MEDVTWSRVGTVTSLFLRCLRIVKNKRLPDDISYRVMTFDTERALTTAKEMVTITVNHLTARAADRLGGRGEKFDAKPEPNSNHKLLWEHGEAEVWVGDCPQPGTHRRGDSVETCLVPQR